MQERLIQKYQRWDHTGSIQNQPSQIYEEKCWRLSGYKRIIRRDHQNCLFNKREISYNKPSAHKKRWDFFFVKRVMVKAGIPPSISEETSSRRVLLKKAGLRLTHVQKVCLKKFL